jgi:hypothetical protein
LATIAPVVRFHPAAALMAQTRRPFMQTDKKLTPEERKKQDDKIDRQMKDSFPASDPPSYSGGKHIIGAPKERESDAPKPDSHAVKDAERKVKDGSAKDPKTY